MEMRRFISIVEATLPADPAFQSWFRGSKVVDGEGNPLRCFHGSFEDVQRPWRPLTHFGTAVAANHRADPAGYGGDEKGSPRLYPVYLRIKNPIWVEDDPDEDPDWHILAAASALGYRPNYDEYRRTTNRHDWGNYLLWVMETVAAKGFDGLAYRNAVEDVSSISWVIFDDEQVWPVIGA